MFKFKKFLKNYIIKVPRLYYLIQNIKMTVREFFDISSRPNFIGWYGMSLRTLPPWINTSSKSKNKLGQEFLHADKELRELVLKGEFRILQFEQYKNVGLFELLDGLMYRHYIVFWSAIIAANNTNSKLKNYVEVGVADGLCMYFTNKAITQALTDCDYKTYLYDTWGDVELFNQSTTGKESGYNYLDINVTKKNLNKYKEYTVYKQGVVPDTFNGENEPNEITWISIDLNSAPPTIDTLNYFWDRLEDGGVILFDDYAQPAYVDTKNAIDLWTTQHSNATLMQLPTSQGIILKSHN